MQISVELALSYGMSVSLRNEAPPDGVVMHVPAIKRQRDRLAMFEWHTITIEVARFGATAVAIPFFVNWLYGKFNDLGRAPKVIIRGREISWDRDELRRAIEEEFEVERKQT
jgi:hypothetical protein